ncbi:cytochrome P450 [Hymenobacter lutimineralis]|uniref:Cytochrome P450 n=1 Tax=Hymenobacter lutimineralis TaxID=2606448 RepID=A0A5D6VE13_9BACT|nr:MULTISPECIES: cytochrome P450 [Hymenobacter]QIX60258.1 cytochrome P450 [Hymenobacter sp. BT18]TYZ14321.1 cytochrome P450 [Hymenobacter lutimineralis]
MALPRFAHLAYQALRQPRKAATRVASWFEAPPETSLFLFAGRYENWPGMGKELYAQEPVFRATIQEIDEYHREFANETILAGFEKVPLEPNALPEHEIVYHILASQLGLCALLRSKGIVPTATLGQSQGEVAAVYAAGGLSLKDAVRINCALTQVNKTGPPTYIPLLILLGMAAAAPVLAACPVPLLPIYESGPEKIMALCHQNDKEAALRYLRTQGVQAQVMPGSPTWPYHTPLIAPHQAKMWEHLQHIRPEPLRVDFYCAFREILIPRGTVLPASYWYDMLASPTYSHTQLQVTSAAGFSNWVYVGHSFLKSQLTKTLRRLPQPPRLIESMQQGQPEAAMVQQACRQLRRTGLGGAPISFTPQVYAEQLDLGSTHYLTDPSPVLAYLRRAAPLYFLPNYNAWLVLDYSLVDTILKEPHQFSSQVHAQFEAALLGADPPYHGLMRKQMQGFFTPAALQDLTGYAVQWTRQHLAALEQEPSFDFVTSLAMPLAQAVANQLLGLPAAVIASLQEEQAGYVYQLSYIDRVAQVLTQWLQNHPAVGQPGVTAHLLRQLAEGTLTTEAVVKLLRLLWLASIATTSAMLSSAMRQLLMHPALAAELRASAELLPRFIEECLRLDPPEMLLHRVTTEAVELGGQRLPAGTVVLLSLCSANRAPEVFDRPDELDMQRPAQRHLAFGGGAHHCIGAFLTRRLVQQVLVEVLLPHPRLRAAAPLEPAQYFPSDHFRALATLPVSCTAPV